MFTWVLGRCVASTVLLVSKRSERADTIGGHLRGGEKCLFSGVTSSGRVWMEVLESGAGVWSAAGLLWSPRALLQVWLLGANAVFARPCTGGRTAEHALGFVGYHWRQLPQVSFFVATNECETNKCLSRQKTNVCRDKTHVATKICLS